MHDETAPSPTADNGRLEDGRFGPGNKVAKGNPHARRVAELRSAMLKAVTADDVKHMRKVVGFIRRHCAQGPKKRIETSRWRYSLMNWGHDPLKLSKGDMPWLD